jgi:hypothetical protein
LYVKVGDVKGEEMKKNKDKKQEVQMKVEPEVVAEIKKMDELTIDNRVVG